MERGFVKILEHTNTIVPKRSIRASRFNDVSMVNAAPWHSWNALTKQSQHWNSLKKQSQHCYLVCLVTTLYDYVGGRITRRLGLETLLSKKENKNMVHTPREMKSTKVNPQRTTNMCAYVNAYLLFTFWVMSDKKKKTQHDIYIYDARYHPHPYTDNLAPDLTLARLRECWWVKKRKKGKNAYQWDSNPHLSYLDKWGLGECSEFLASGPTNGCVRAK